MHGDEHLNPPTDQNRLASYKYDPASLGYVTAQQCDWGSHMPCDFEWSLTSGQSVSTGFYAEVKVGVDIKHKLGFGVEGSFEFTVTTTSELGIGAKSYFRNPEPTQGYPDPVEGFTTRGYWMKPNSTAYWVPSSRKGLGDTPWFMAYYIVNP